MDWIDILDKICVYVSANAIRTSIKPNLNLFRWVIYHIRYTLKKNLLGLS